MSVAVAASVGCAAPASSSRNDWLELKVELRSLRARNSELEQRIARLEDRSATQKLSMQSVQEDVPPLTVVKLKPKREPAPRVDTRTTVVEPDPELLDNLSPGSTLGNASSEVPAEDPAVLEVQYEEAVGSLKTGNVDGSITQLEQFAKDHPKHPRADNALYFAGLGRMGLKEYNIAARTFEQLLAKYPAGDAVSDAMLKLAECRVRLRRSSDARILYAQIVANYPGTAAATQAEEQLSAMSR